MKGHQLKCTRTRQRKSHLCIPFLGIAPHSKGGFFASAHPSDSTVSEDAEIEPRTVATLKLTARRSNHAFVYIDLIRNLARFHPHLAISHPHLARSHPHLARSHFHIHVPVSDLYIPRIGPHIFMQQNRQMGIYT